MGIAPTLLAHPMLNVFLKLIITQPRLLLTHAENYGDLVMEVLQRASMQWQHRLFLYALSLGFFVFGLACAAVSLLLFSALPVLDAQSAWILPALPTLLLVISAILYLVAKRSTVEPLWQDIQEQLALDMLSLREVSTK